MPPVIKQTTKVSEEFIDVMLSMYSVWMTLNKPMIQRGGNETARRLGMTAKRLLPIVRRQSPDLRAGFEYELTRLRRMPYSEFYVVMDVNPRGGGDIPWLIGRTNHITMTKWDNRKKVMGEMGCYEVCIPSTMVKHPDMGNIHMIPTRNPSSTYRHPHHAAYNSGLDSVRSRATRNCYGSYSGVIKGLMDEPDIPELFRQLHNHLSTYGYLPPVKLEQIDFDIHTKE